MTRFTFCAVLILAAACSEPRPRAAAGGVSCGEKARRVARDFGGRLRLVSLLAPDSVQRVAIRDAYEGIVTPELLERWLSGSEPAPGRQVSNPFPARIDIRDVEADTAACTISGDVVHVTSADTSTAVDRQPITLQLRDVDGWHVSSVVIGSAAADDTQARAAAAADVVRQYYQAINTGDYRAAYHMWADDGAASRQTEEQFVTGFAGTRSVSVAVSDSVAMEGAAGSQYATVPVTIDAVQDDGTRQRFAGSYTLRRSMVDGATPAQRRWHIYSAKIRDSSR